MALKKLDQKSFSCIWGESDGVANSMAFHSLPPFESLRQKWVTLQSSLNTWKTIKAIQLVMVNALQRGQGSEDLKNGLIVDQQHDQALPTLLLLLPELP